MKMKRNTPPHPREFVSAIIAGELEEVRTMHDAGASVTEGDEHGWLPIHRAAANDRDEIIKLLLQWGSPLEPRGTEGWTPLHLACVSGSSCAVIALLLAGADPNARSEFGTTPLHLAITGERRETVQALLFAGARVDARNEEGTTALDVARERKKSELQNILEHLNPEAPIDLATGYNITISNSKPTFTAVVRGRVEPNDFHDFVLEACGEVWIFVRTAGLPRAGRHVALYLHNGMVEVGTEISEKFVGNGRVHCSTLPTGRVATTAHFGPYARLGEAHSEIRRWCAEHGEPLSNISWEIYHHSDESWSSDLSKIRTDVFQLLQNQPT
jgi:effector-binding domain-containing protein